MSRLYVLCMKQTNCLKFPPQYKAKRKYYFQYVRFLFLRLFDKSGYVKCVDSYQN